MSYYLSNLRERIFGTNNNDNNNNKNNNKDYKENDTYSTTASTSNNDLITTSFKTDLYQSVLVDKVRVLVIGDTAVGKSSLVHLICNDEILTRSPSWTVGCNTDVKMHEYHSKDYYIEFIDIGGSSKYKITRPILYHQINGIIVVYDLTNKISLTNVKKWLFDILNKISNSSSNWKLKETEHSQILELENQTEQNNNYNNNNNNEILFNNNNNNNVINNNTNTNKNKNTDPNIRRLNFINSHNNNGLQSTNTSSVNLNNNIRPSVFLSQNSLFLPTNTVISPPTQSPINKIKIKSKKSNSHLNIPVLILGNKSDLSFDKKFIESDSLGKLSLLVSAKVKNQFSSSQSPHVASRLEIFYNKMISNIISNKRGINANNMTFNNQIYGSLNNTNNNNNIKNDINKNNTKSETVIDNIETTDRDDSDTKININDYTLNYDTRPTLYSIDTNNNINSANNSIINTSLPSTTTTTTPTITSTPSLSTTMYPIEHNESNSNSNSGYSSFTNTNSPPLFNTSSPYHYNFLSPTVSSPINLNKQFQQQMNNTIPRTPLRARSTSFENKNK
ncbi:LIP1/RABL3-like protein, Ras superfamily GTPase [Dictyostelium purpureum]|uniref:LIP1/RABL3-like protein, Ras superfamily GTPase n=1 Tax=Dictyostelium purpureum TaxID=5786 RepID=F0ZFI8_DICPU|nr:LIP1/RABL3-like protein, Ras superfamily GTPase [Dictyostelium purpureum]EGC37288.1 LIP1/RABL3-like protein, Ras superfamily GTPase [Dictyostelium purpureum]|eukprot:XP_003286176.1 LIP1/RABL3-like protein, Ras superfamily GTPase [Dictyostelium purpureum]